MSEYLILNFSEFVAMKELMATKHNRTFNVIDMAKCYLLFAISIAFFVNQPNFFA